jgi:hypothetical protein
VVTNRELWQSYDFYSSELTKHSRHLGFAGAAVCWFFRTPEVTFPKWILVALVMIVAYFLLDLLQYYSGAILRRFWIQREESKMYQATGSIEGEYLMPRWLDRPTSAFFVFKTASLLLAFVAIGVELVTRLV